MKVIKLLNGCESVSKSRKKTREDGMLYDINSAYGLGLKEKAFVVKDVVKAVKAIDDILNSLGRDYCPYEELEAIRDMLYEHVP